MRNIYEIIQNYLKNGKIGAVATVISRNGSAPRDVGAKMFVEKMEKFMEPLVEVNSSILHISGLWIQWAATKLKLSIYI